MRKRGYILPGLIATAMISCGTDKHTTALEADGDVVAQYRDTVLRVSDVVRLLPPGISSGDSALLAKSIIDEWIDGFLIEDLAASQIDDIDRIERLTSSYRRSLIAESYRRKMRRSGVQPVDKEGVKDYYAHHKSELKLERPIIKGLYIKVPSMSRYLDDIRHWMQEAGANSFDQLENIGSKETTTYRYFADRWVDLDAITGEIPYKFGDSDEFVESTKDFETEHNGTVHILHIIDYRHSGGLMPEEYATPIIEDRIKNNNLADYERGLIKALRQTAIEKNILKEGTYTR